MNFKKIAAKLGSEDSFIGVGLMGVLLLAAVVLMAVLALSS